MSRNEPLRVTVAIPVFNERENIRELVRRLSAVLDTVGPGPHSILFVDDGSTDGTGAVLEELRVEEQRISVISLSRNFGHQVALTAALDHAAGDVVVVMDGDLQDRPEAIPTFLREYERGYDVVYAVRVRRKEGLLLRSCYRAFYWLMTRLSSAPLPEGSGDFGLLSRRAVAALSLHREQHRYIRGLRALVGFKQIGIEVERDARHAGDSRYGFVGLLRLAFDGLFAFSVAPIRAATLLGALAVIGCLLYTGFAVWAKLAGRGTPQGFTTLIVAMVFLAGVQLLFLGVIGEYVGRIYEEAKSRPLYLIESKRGFPDDETRDET